MGLPPTGPIAERYKFAATEVQIWASNGGCTGRSTAGYGTSRAADTRVGITGAAFTYAFHPLLSYSRPTVMELVLMAVAIGAFGYIFRPFQSDRR